MSEKAFTSPSSWSLGVRQQVYSIMVMNFFEYKVSIISRVIRYEENSVRYTRSILLSPCLFLNPGFTNICGSGLGNRPFYHLFLFSPALTRKIGQLSRY